VSAAAAPASPTRFASPEAYTPKHLAERILTSKAALEGERKQVTVLFADVVGFSTLSERLDPEAVHTIMDGCFELLSRAVHRYEGTVNQFTGDGIMALFGAPITHEDHAIRALQAALAIQTDVAGYGDAVQRRFGLPFQMRIGINTGTVVGPDRRQPSHGLHRPGRHDEPRGPSAADGPARGDLGG
jgi:class 3 adenylate cyclase